MRYKIAVLLSVGLAIAVIMVLPYFKNGENTGQIEVNLQDKSSSTLVAEAVSTGKPAWLLFHSTT